MNMLSQMGILAKLTITIGFVPLVMAIVYVVRPTEHNLALMRPLSSPVCSRPLQAPSWGSSACCGLSGQGS